MVEAGLLEVRGSSLKGIELSQSLKKKEELVHDKEQNSDYLDRAQTKPNFFEQQELETRLSVLRDKASL